ncbi:MAG: hypothetical protein IJH84_28335 [Saccharopolyspora sp.]|uniref:hypothetical protein n=1 Tax=Saccharopolyspora sp. TaxID=33915 RepID=UPI0025CF7E4E|nr:hypothetical protein [Saccharopolyspora sp.]MBQ6644907.1 hypothetical protein [Saccharopolyspora sp.]
MLKAVVRIVPDDWAVLQKQGIIVPLDTKLLVPDLSRANNRRLGATGRRSAPQR